jgi:hypothetical protein
VLARDMSGIDYSIIALVWTAVVIAGALSCLGFHTWVIHFMPEQREKGDGGRATRDVILASRLLTHFCLDRADRDRGFSLSRRFPTRSSRSRPRRFLIIAQSNILEGLVCAQFLAVVSLAPVCPAR